MKLPSLTGTLLFIFFSLMASAQTVNLGIRQKSSIESDLRSQYEGINVDSIRWKINADSLFEGAFQYGNQEFTATFDRQGNWVRTAEQLDLNDLPDDFRLFLKEHYEVERVSDISAIERIETRGNEDYYLVHIHARDPIKFDLNGNPLDQGAYTQ